MGMIDEQVFLKGVEQIIEEGIKPVLKGRSKFIIEHAWYTSPHFKAVSLYGVTTELERVHCDITLEEYEERSEYEWAVMVAMLTVLLPIRKEPFGGWSVQSVGVSVRSLQKEPFVGKEFVENVRIELEGAEPTHEYVEPEELDFDLFLRSNFVRELYDEVVSIYFLRLLAGC